VTGVFSVTGSGTSLNEVLAGLVNDVAAGVRNNEPGSAQLSAQFAQLQTASQAQTSAVSQNTQAVLQNTAAQTSGGGGSTAASIGTGIAKYYTSGLTLSPLLSGLLKLFGGGGDKKEEPPPLVKYSWPPSIQFEGSISRSGAAAGTSWLEPGGPQEGASTPGPQITVQVQAIDSRSFLDHREEIAQAVREAMLNSHSLNDVVNEL
jgi:hypothetical protein